MRSMAEALQTSRAHLGQQGLGFAACMGTQFVLRFADTVLRIKAVGLQRPITSCSMAHVFGSDLGMTINMTTIGAIFALVSCMFP